MSDKYVSIAIRGWSSLTEVRLYEETLEHIIEEHSEFQLELPSQRTGLEAGIGNPTSVHASTTDPARSVVLVSAAFTYNNDPVHVPVKLVEGTSGRVRTAYFASGTYPGKVLWSATDE